MEKFEVYKFDNVFYTKEEIEKMGLSLFDYDELKKLAKDKDIQQYTIAIYSPSTRKCDSLSNYLETFNKDKMVFLMDCGDCAAVVDFTFLYGIRFNENLILFESSKSRDSEYSSIERLIFEQMGKVRETNYIVGCNSQAFQKQEELATSKQKLLELLSMGKQL